MRVLSFVIFILLTLLGSAVLSDDSNTTNGSRNGISDNKTKLLPDGFAPLNKGIFDDLTLHISENWELDQLLGSNSRWTKKEFDWLNWLESRDNGGSRVLLGGLPFLSIPTENRRDENEREPTFFSTDKFLFFWYFKQKF